jgi:antitoxin HicB
MATTNRLECRQSLDNYLTREYPFQVLADPDGGYVIVFPDLPGCMTQVDRVDDIGPMAEDARRGWIETAYERGMEISPPSYPSEYSGKFNLRIPRSLHRQLAEGARRDGVSLNQYVETLLARRDAQISLERRLDRVEERLTAIQR